MDKSRSETDEYPKTFMDSLAECWPTVLLFGIGFICTLYEVMRDEATWLALIWCVAAGVNWVMRDIMFKQATRLLDISGRLQKLCETKDAYIRILEYRLENRNDHPASE